MKWRATAAILVLAVVAGVTAGMVAAVWTGTRTTSGDVSATSGSPNLYICEPNADPLNTGCGPDDDGGTGNMADETIFEGTEELLPGGHVWAPVRLLNLSETEPLKIRAANVTVGGGTPDACDDAIWDELRKKENVSVWILGKWADLADIPRDPGEEFMGMAYSPSDVLTNDNFPSTEGYELETYKPTLMDGVYPGWPTITITENDYTHEDYTSPYRVDYGSKWAVHIAPGDYEDMAVRVRLPYDLPAECEGNVWDISIDWEVVSSVDTGTIVIRQEGLLWGFYDDYPYDYGVWMYLPPGEVRAISGLEPGEYLVETFYSCPLQGFPSDYYVLTAWCDAPDTWWSLTGPYYCVPIEYNPRCCSRIDIDLLPGRSILCHFLKEPQ